MISYTIPLDVTPSKYPPRIYLSQYDSDFTLKFRLFSSDGDFTYLGMTAMVRGTKADGNGYSNTASVSGNIVTVTGDAQMTAVAGENVFEIVMNRSGKELSTCNFILDVKRATLDKDTITSQSEIRELIDISDRVQEIVDAAMTVEDAAYQINSNLDQMQQLHDETVDAAENIASDIRTELGADIREVRNAKTYIEEYINGLIYGDEVEY